MSTLLAAMFVLPSCDKGDNPVAYVDFTHLRKYNSKDKEHLPHMWDMLHTTATLQGIVNREYGFSTAVGLFNSVVNIVFLVVSNQISKKVTETFVH